MMHINAFDTVDMPTIDIDHSYVPYKRHRTYLTNHMRSISHYIMPLVLINSLGGGHTQTHTYRHLQTEVILRNQTHAWFNNNLV